MAAISQTSDTADTYGMFDRDLRQEGKVAHINIIDFERLRLFRSEAIFDLPTGSRRLVRRVEGYEGTIKSGTVIFKSGDHTGALPGRLIRRRKEKPPTSIAAE